MVELLGRASEMAVKISRARNRGQSHEVGTDGPGSQEEGARSQLTSEEWHVAAGVTASALGALGLGN